jgi:eukaryotic-like serine/threonine-protein kinase
MVASRGPLPPVGAARVAVQVCATLAAAHAQGRTHGHLTPANVLLRIDGQVELTGFRLAPAARPLAAAPDPDDDLRALGRCMVVMLTGREPAAGEGVALGPEVAPELAAIVTRAAGPQRSYRSADHLGRDLARFLATAVSREAPAHRPPATAGTSAGAVRLLSSSRVASPKSAAAPGAASSPARHRRGLALAAGLVGAGLFLVGAVVAVGLVGGEPRGPDTDQAPAPPSTPVPATTSQPAVGGAATTTVPATTTTPPPAPPAPAGRPGSGQAAGPGQRTVPDVVGLHRQQAVGVLTEAQLGVQIIRFQVDGSGQVQRVVAQQPPAGQVVPAESVVRLLVGTRRPST